MSWIKRLWWAVSGNASASGENTSPSRKPVAGQAVEISEATRRALRQGFRSNTSDCEHPARALMAIPATHIAPSSFDALAGARPASGKPSSDAPLPPAPAKPRGKPGSTAAVEPTLIGAAWTGVPHPVLAPFGSPAGTVLSGLKSTGEAPGPVVFGELTGAVALDMSPAPAEKAVASPSDVLGAAPSWISPDVLSPDERSPP